jgi:hypothetical protein
MEKCGTAIVLFAVGALLAACNNPTTSTVSNQNNFGLSLSTSTLTVPAGDVGSVTLTVTRNGAFTDPVEISFSNSSACTATPPTVASNQTTTTVTCSSFTKGTTDITINALAQSVTNGSAAIHLTLIVT